MRLPVCEIGSIKFYGGTFREVSFCDYFIYFDSSWLCFSEMRISFHAAGDDENHARPVKNAISIVISGYVQLVVKRPK